MRCSVCFICLGNICRSPTAEGVFRDLVERAGLADAIAIDSAGTAAYHSGEPPDKRSAAAARDRGITLGGRARQFMREDFTVRQVSRRRFMDGGARRGSHDRNFQPGGLRGIRVGWVGRVQAAGGVGRAPGADLYAAVLVVGAHPADASEQRFWARKQVMEVTTA